MPKARHKVLLTRSVEDVFPFLADCENETKWRPQVVEIGKLSGDGVGATYRQRVRGPMGLRIPADFRITEFQPNRLIAFQTIAGPVRPVGRYELEATDGGTSVAFSLEAELSGVKRPMSKMVAKAMQSEVRALENLRAVLERQ